MTKIELQVHICKQLQRKRMKFAEFFTLCAAVDLQAKKIPVTKASMKDAVSESDSRYNIQKLIRAGYMSEYLLPESQRGKQKNCIMGYSVTQKGISTLSFILNTK